MTVELNEVECKIIIKLVQELTNTVSGAMMIIKEPDLNPVLNNLESKLKDALRKEEENDTK